MIISRTPLRASFAGGGTDLAEFYSQEAGAVCSTAIDKYMYITVNRRFDETIRVSYSKTEIVNNIEELQHELVREALRVTGVTKQIEITSIADIPAGTGMGSSSTFTVGLLNALYAYQGQYVSDEQLAAEACQIEIDEVGEPIGKQDQYIAAYGGLKYIQFNPDETVFVDPVICTQEAKQELGANLMMFYTGTTRKASDILTQQKEDTGKKLDVLKKMRDLAGEIRKVLIRGTHLAEFGEILNEGWLLKKSLVATIANTEIDDWYDAARDAGALGGKLLGAGGGGFLLLYVERQNQDRVREALSQLKELPFHLEPQGTKIIYVGG
ncbi:MAG: GHMP kinase [Phycisphaerae bacterium]|nr:GHMP kinase [Phycisphaerae bacterium]